MGSARNVQCFNTGTKMTEFVFLSHGQGIKGVVGLSIL